MKHSSTSATLDRCESHTHTHTHTHTHAMFLADTVTCAHTCALMYVGKLPGAE